MNLHAEFRKNIMVEYIANNFDLSKIILDECDNLWFNFSRGNIIRDIETDRDLALIYVCRETNKVIHLVPKNQKKVSKEPNLDIDDYNRQYKLPDGRCIRYSFNKMRKRERYCSWIEK